jgi:hypothetical protein
LTQVTVAGMASSHGLTFWKPEAWEARRGSERARFKTKYGLDPAEVALMQNETVAANTQRFREITNRLIELRDKFASFVPDVLILLGDDQDEHFRDQIPQFSIYTGDRIVAIDREATGSTPPVMHRNHAELAQYLYAHCVDDGFDVLESRAFLDDRLISRAHAQVIDFLQPSVPVIPISLNAIHVPAPTPMRCYAFGMALRRALAEWPSPLRVVVYASGGLSQFNAEFPFRHYYGPYALGSIDEEFDHQIFAWLRRGENARLATLSSSALIDHGELQLRQWITLMGVLGDRRPQWLVYEPFYRAIMGMGVGYWAPFDLPEPVGAER